MSTTHTLTGNVRDLIGQAAFTSAATNTIRGYIEAWTNKLNGGTTGTTDDQDNLTLLGRHPITFGDDGAWTAVGLPATGEDQGWTPIVQALRVVLIYLDPYGGDSDKWVSGFFQLTADSEMKDVIAAEVEAIEDAHQAALDAQAAAATAESWAQAAQEIAVPAALDELIDDKVAESTEGHTPGISLGAPKRESPFTTTNVTNTSTAGNINELQKTIVGKGRPVRLVFYCTAVYHSVANTDVSVAIIRDGNILGSDTQIGYESSAFTTKGKPLIIFRETNPLLDGVSYTFTVRVWGAAAGTCTLLGATYCPVQLSYQSA